MVSFAAMSNQAGRCYLVCIFGVGVECKQRARWRRWLHQEQINLHWAWNSIYSLSPILTVPPLILPWRKNAAGLVAVYKSVENEIKEFLLLAYKCHYANLRTWNDCTQVYFILPRENSIPSPTNHFLEIENILQWGWTKQSRRPLIHRWRQLSVGRSLAIVSPFGI